MSRIVLRGVNGANPLGFLASLGVLRLLHAGSDAVRMGFLTDGSFVPFVDGSERDIATLVAEDAAGAGGPQPWSLEYEKEEKNGKKVVADLKAPPAAFRAFLDRSLASWASGEDDGAAYAAAFGTSVAVDGKGNTKPTAFHFTAANQQFLGTLETIRASVNREWVQRSLFDGYAAQPGPNLRWDPAAERNWALMANNPNDEGTGVDAPLEWLAFRGLPLLPSFPQAPRGGFAGRTKIVTTAVSGRGDDMKMTWPLWSVPISIPTARSLLQLDWTGTPRDRAERGVFAVCTSAIRRTPQGFGNFGPAIVES